MMRRANWFTHVTVYGALASACSTLCLAQTEPVPSPAALLQQMQGEWSVSQRMWPGAGADPVNLPPAVAHRRVVGNSFLEELMEAAQRDSKDAFTRIALFDYNPVTRRYEYFSLDSRLPQMMNERSRPGDAHPAQASNTIALAGSHFVAPMWGKASNVPFRYRLIVGDVHDDRQVVQLYLTPDSGTDRREFLAFDYVYARVVSR
jgi:Protein of unknown function (DUF1579)